MNDPLGYGERVFEFLAMFGVITDLLGIKIGPYTDKKAATGYKVILCEEGAVVRCCQRGV